MKKAYIWIAILIIAALAVFFGYRVYRGEYTAQRASATVASVQDVRKTVMATGNITSWSNLKLSFKNGGILKTLDVKVSDKVHAGDALATLDQKDANATVSQANAALSAAQASYDKLIRGASGPEIDVAKAAVSSAQLALNNAQINLENTQQQQDLAVKNAYSTLLNSTISAVPSST